MDWSPGRCGVFHAKLSLTSASTLATLERTGPRRITDLAEIEGVTQPAMTVLIRVLEKSGMVERRADPADKRVALVAVTEAGVSYVRSRRKAVPPRSYS